MSQPRPKDPTVVHHLRCRLFHTLLRSHLRECQNSQKQIDDRRRLPATRENFAVGGMSEGRASGTVTGRSNAVLFGMLENE